MLDPEEEKQYIFIYHQSNKNIYKVSADAAIKISGLLSSIISCDNTIINNPEGLPISYGSEEVFQVFIRYLDFYSHQEERSPPDCPLPDGALSFIFEEEKLIFGELLDPDTNTEKNIVFLKHLLDFSSYMAADYLLGKIAAITAYYVRHKRDSFISAFK
jgi:hypothetical protein